MENRLNHYNRECLKMAMLKHEETFREQVYELHRLYQIQKALMKNVAKTRPQYCFDLESPTEPDRINLPGKCGLSGTEDDESDLELTLGPRSYYQKKIKASEPARLTSDSGLSFSSSASSGSRTPAGEDLLSWSTQTLNQDKLSSNSPPWFLQALSLNIT